MTRTKKGAKGPGYEFWSRRTPTKNCGSGKISKRITNKAERQKAKKETKVK